MIAASQASTLRALAARLRTRVSKGSHKSEVLELIDLLDAALADEPEALPPASPPAAEPAAPSPPTAQEQQRPSQTEAVERQEVAGSPRKTLADFFGKWPGDESEAELLAKLRAMDAPALDTAALHDIARAAREASLALDTLTQRIKHALESAPPPVAAAAQLSTPQPADAPVPESAAESQANGGGADADLPPGWRAGFMLGMEAAEYGVRGEENPVVYKPKAGDHVGEWSWFSAWSRESGYAPTKLQAMCAALGIVLEQRPYHLHTYARVGETWVNALDPDACARAALAAFHARQQAPERPAGCMCPGQQRHERCPLHGAQGAPELGPRERGMR